MALLQRFQRNVQLAARGIGLLPPAKRTLGLPEGFTVGVGAGSRPGFAAADISNLLKDFNAQSRSADSDLFNDNRILRARARSLCINNPFAKKFLQMVSQNVVGPSGVLLQAKVRNEHGKETADTKRINARIEQEWTRWCRMGRPTADGKFSFLGLQHLAIKNWAREGENFLRDVYGRQFNDTGYAVQLLDNDQVDDTFTQPTNANGTQNEVRMGVEVDMYGRAQAYWIYLGNPFDPIANRERRRIRIPAAEMTHTALWERPGQSRGYTPMSASILGMHQYGRYEEAVIVASRASAAKFAVIQQKAAEGWSPEDEEGGEEQHDHAMNATTGEIPVLDLDQELNFIDPKFPTSNHETFTRAMLRNIATGLLVSYPSLGNDLEGVNFSSIRAGMLDERDCWRIVQRWFVEAFLEPIFQKWLRFALLTTLQDITLTGAQREQISWKARGWDWVDPLKDAQAIVLKLQNGLITYADALAALGLDFEETMTERAMEQAFLDALGITLGTDIRGQADTAEDDSMNSTGNSSGGGKSSGKGGDSKKGRTIEGDFVRVQKAIELFRDLRATA